VTLRPPTEAELDGERLYGEDLTAAEVAEWFQDEREAYARLGSADRETYRYPDHGVNARHGFRFLPRARFEQALGLGSAHGDEFLPLQDRLGEVTIVEPSSALRVCRLRVPFRYLDPTPSGRIPLEEGSIDLALCLGVLHHIPSVSTAISELGRILRPGGYALIREPTVSMGDWTRSRPGLTPHERGIPLLLLVGLIRDTGLEIVRVTRYAFPASSQIARALRADTYNTPWLVRLDEIASRAFAWNRRYHARRWYEKLRPTAAFVVARRPRAP